MAYCKYCGKELPADGKCLCPQGQMASAMKGAESESGKPFLDNGISDSTDVANQKKQRNWLLIFGVLLLVIIVLISCISSSASKYKKPVKDFVKGINKSDSMLVLESMFSDEILESLKSRSGMTEKEWKKAIKKADESLEDELKESKIKKYSVKFLDKEKIKGDRLEVIKGVYDTLGGAEVKKAYKLDIELTVKKKGDDETHEGSVFVVNLKGDGWKMYPYSDTAGLSDLFDWNF